MSSTLPQVSNLREGLIGGIAVSQKAENSKRHALRRALLVGVAFILGFVVLGVAAIQTWEYSNSSDFCANVCHDVHPEEPSSYHDSYHANVKCTECHMGRVGTLEAIALKASHARHLPAVLLGQYGRPLESETMRPASESCERCHWPPAPHGDTVVEARRFQPDEANTERRTYLILRTGDDAGAADKGSNIHWHIANPVEYIATDEHKQTIRWVRVTLPDGRTVEYNDAANPLSPEEIAQAEKRTMDCTDCHNRVGHPFPSPEQLVDEALAEGRLSPDLPYAKKEMLALLTTPYTSQEEALTAVESVEERYKAAYPEIAASHEAEIRQAADLAKELVSRLVFEKPGVTWQSFPDEGQHKDFPGCFRCHDGQHLTAEGEPIRLTCDLCHNVPQTVGAEDAPPMAALAYVEEPESHLEANFIADHRFQAGDECAECHGEIAFGRDDSSFCANSACHSQTWPEIELDAGQPHPIELTDKHAEAQCYDCHRGEQEIEYECADCHQPPEAHYGPDCQECHTPAGFESPDLARFRHPQALIGQHADQDCAACHASGEPLTDECAACHQPPSDHPAGTCETCHTPYGWVDAPPYLAAQSPPIPHEIYKGEDCLFCHAPGAVIWPAPSDDHAEYGNGQCLLCHRSAP